MRSFIRSKTGLVLIGIVFVALTATPSSKANDIQSVLHVNANLAGAGDGTSWEDAYNDLQEALAVAISGNKIWVATGTYAPGEPGKRTATFRLISGVSVDDGFAGTEISLGARDPATNPTVVSSDLNGNCQAGPSRPGDHGDTVDRYGTFVAVRTQHRIFKGFTEWLL